jgi:putative phosphoribosyl transferase
MFLDRAEAGKKLAVVLSDLRGSPDPLVVLAIPRGGVLVAHEIAQALHAPLDVCLTHKIGAPGNSELAIGAVADDGTTLLDQTLIAALHVSPQHVTHEIDLWRQELTRRAEVYRQGRARVSVKEAMAIVVDDGVATGSTLIAALRSTRTAGAKTLIAAVPVGPHATVHSELAHEADRVECLLAPYEFYAVGAFYRYFAQVTDEEVIEAMNDDPLTMTN